MKAIDFDLNGTKKSPKACVASLRASRLGMYSRGSASGQATGGGSPPRMG
ncbi:MAG: hypothetical protein V7L04_00860 [Nostoc sp.]